VAGHVAWFLPALLLAGQLASARTSTHLHPQHRYLMVVEGETLQMLRTQLVVAESGLDQVLLVAEDLVEEALPWCQQLEVLQ